MTQKKKSQTSGQQFSKPSSKNSPEGSSNGSSEGTASRSLLDAFDRSTSRSKMVHGKPMTNAWEFSKHLIPPITSNTTFRLGSLDRGAQGFINFGSEELSGDPRYTPILIYDRLDEPNALLLEEHLAHLEGSESAVSFGSGMGAISSAFLSVINSGQKIIAHRNLYGCTYSLLSSWLPRFGVNTTFIDVNSKEQRQLLSDPKVRVLYFESVSNPNLDLADLPTIMSEVKRINRTRSETDRIITIVDNTFATPWSLRPIEWGVDFVVHSLTKNIGGFGTEMGGAVMCPKAYEKGLKLARKDFGAILNPKSAWGITVHGIPTLALRFEKQQENAIAVARFLENHPKVESVIYPGLKSYPQAKLAKKLLKTPENEFAPGSMVSFVLKGNMAKCRKVVDYIAKNSYSITLAVSLGLTKTLIEVPGYMTHSTIPKDKQAASGIDSRLIRLSLGIEDKKDLIKDFDAALRQI